MTSRFSLALSILASVVAGCQTYERQPLELQGYAESWSERTLDLQSIREYASALAADQPEPVPWDSTDGLSLTEAEAVALHFNPNLRVARAEAEVPLAGAEQAGWWPDPQFEAEVMHFANRGRRDKFRFDGPSFDGLNSSLISPTGLSASGVEFTQPGYRRVGRDFIDEPWIIGAGLSLTIPISGRLAVEEDLAWASYSAAWRRILVAEWELLVQLRDDWLAWSTDEQRVTMTKAYLQRLESVADIAQRLAQAGEMKPTEARVLNIELATERARLIGLESKARQKRLALHAMLGIAPHAPVELQADVFVPSVTVSPEGRRTQLLDNHPRIAAARADYETAEQRLKLEIREQYPDLQIGPGYSFEEGFSRLGLGFGLPIPLWNFNRQAVAEALAERDAARSRAEAHVELVLSELAHVESRLAHASRQRQYLLDEVVPLVDKQMEDSRTLLSLGEVNVLLLREALTSSLDTKLAVLDATLAEAQAANALQQMLEPRWFTPSQSDTQEDQQ